MRSLSSRVLRWPDASSVVHAARKWACELGRSRQDVLKAGCFGSLARGNWCFGSDLDMVLVLTESALPFIDRASGFDTTTLPVPTDILVYTQAEWEALSTDSGPFWRRILDEVMWLYERDTV
ncbi:MAG: nucleotidyltransferase domain-containing protein [Ignavibacteriales bacterium]